MTTPDADKPKVEICAIVGKQCHAKKADAVAHAHRQRKASQRTMAGKVSTFMCGFCGMYHIGRR
jgi:hypothetical protein